MAQQQPKRGDLVPVTEPQEAAGDKALRPVIRIARAFLAAMHTATDVAMRELDALEHRGEGTGEKVHELGNGVRLGVLVGKGDNPVGLLVEFPCPECQERVQWLIQEGLPPNLGHSPPGCETWKSSQADPTSTQARAYRAECQRLTQAAVEAAGGPARGGFDDDGPIFWTG